MTLPTGNLIIKSSPDLPFLFLPPPALPFGAMNLLLFLKSANVFRPSFAWIMIEPPVPPSPPSGPPNGIYYSLLKLKQPFPPLPALTRIMVSSINFIYFFLRSKRFSVLWVRHSQTYVCQVLFFETKRIHLLLQIMYDLCHIPHLDLV